MSTENNRKAKYNVKSCFIATLIAIVIPSVSLAGDTLRIVGSSTVFPFSSAVAEEFGRRTGSKTPVVESTGSGGGLKLFCAGAGAETPDITNASRRIKASEVELCGKNGVGDIVEVEVGFDGIVIANTRDAKAYDLTTKQIFQALAKQVPIHGKLVENPYKKWSDIDPNLPGVAIEVFGPPPTSGTRDAFVELAMESGAKKFPMLSELKSSDKKAFKAVAHTLREDGAYLDAGENDNLIVRKLGANPTALGIFGFSFLDRNADRVQGSLVNGVAPTFEAIADGNYAISRSLFFYAKKAHVDQSPGLTAYIAEFTSERAAGDDGYLVDKGLIPLPAAKRKSMREHAKALTPLEL
jgi:phosphate transport system substrate-binding protein